MKASSERHAALMRERQRGIVRPGAHERIPGRRLTPAERAWREINQNLVAWWRNRPLPDDRHALTIAIGVLSQNGANEYLIKNLVEMLARIAQSAPHLASSEGSRNA